jgi:hypothetical protein
MFRAFVDDSQASSDGLSLGEKVKKVRRRTFDDGELGQLSGLLGGLVV